MATVTNESTKTIKLNFSWIRSLPLRIKTFFSRMPKGQNKEISFDEYYAKMEQAVREAELANKFRMEMTTALGRKQL